MVYSGLFPFVLIALCVAHDERWTAQRRPMMSFAGRLDELPRPFWIALAILGFLFWWPLGLAILAYLLWSGKMRCCGIAFGNWRGDMDRQTQNSWHQPRTSGNQAFDEYRAATLRRLEEEQREFGGVLSRLRMAKHKAEFDQFMAERGTRSEPQPQP
jgi:Protein of unknown function (DUF2852)